MKEIFLNEESVPTPFDRRTFAVDNDQHLEEVRIYMEKKYPDCKIEIKPRVVTVTKYSTY